MFQSSSAEPQIQIWQVVSSQESDEEPETERPYDFFKVLDSVIFHNYRAGYTCRVSVGWTEEAFSSNEVPMGILECFRGVEGAMVQSLTIRGSPKHCFLKDRRDLLVGAGDTKVKDSPGLYSVIKSCNRKCMIMLLDPYNNHQSPL